MHSGLFLKEYEKVDNSTCRKCKRDSVYRRIWESSCGGYEDKHYKCADCGYDWWIEGPDA